jgi:hypothetical protein
MSGKATLHISTSLLCSSAPRVELGHVDMSVGQKRVCERVADFAGAFSGSMHRGWMTLHALPLHQFS